MGWRRRAVPSGGLATSRVRWRAADGATTKLTICPASCGPSHEGDSLPEPIGGLYERRATRMKEEGEVAFTSRVCRGAAEHILRDGRSEGECGGRAAWPRAQSSRLLEFQNDLEQVRSSLPLSELHQTPYTAHTARTPFPHIPFR